MEIVRETAPDNANGYGRRLVGYRLTVDEDLTDGTRHQLREVLQAILRPAERDEIIQALEVLGQALPSQGGDAVSYEVWLEACWVALEEFPADIINQACRTSIKRDRWRPAPAELRGECYHLNRKRDALRHIEIVKT